MNPLDELKGQEAKALKDKFEELFGQEPRFEPKEPGAESGKHQYRVINAPGGLLTWGKRRDTQQDAETEALRLAFTRFQKAVPANATAALQRSEPSSPGSYAASAPMPVASAQQNHASGESNVSGHELVYPKRDASKVPPEVLDLVDAFEQAPSARGALNVLEVRRAKVPDHLKSSWEAQKMILQDRNLDPDFPKPEWQDQGPSRDDIDELTKECLRREREEVAWQLLTMSHKHEGGARSCRVYHGCRSETIMESICRTGFAGNIQNTKGWFGEGLYSTLNAPYALRYALGMRDFWEKPGEVGWVIAAKLIYLHVYPVTEADNSTPLEPGLKGKRIGDADGARGCDCQFVCVRGRPPDHKHKNRTYHACKHGERPEATEIVVNQEARILPEYLIKVQVTNDQELCTRIQRASELWGRHAASSPTSAPQHKPPIIDPNQHSQRLIRLVKEKLGKAPIVKDDWHLVKKGETTVEDETTEGDLGDIHYRLPHQNLDGLDVASVYVGVLGKYVQGCPQLRKKAAKQSAAQEACKLIENS
eukprot:Skav208991  [mRNA]  locus=scaffold2686:90247:91851:+ [translate_table: standard]